MLLIYPEVRGNQRTWSSRAAGMCLLVQLGSSYPSIEERYRGSGEAFNVQEDKIQAAVWHVTLIWISKNKTVIRPGHGEGGTIMYQETSHCRTRVLCRYFNCWCPSNSNFLALSLGKPKITLKDSRKLMPRAFGGKKKNFIFISVFDQHSTFHITNANHLITKIWKSYLNHQNTSTSDLWKRSTLVRFSTTQEGGDICLLWGGNR